MILTKIVFWLGWAGLCAHSFLVGVDIAEANWVHLLTDLIFVAVYACAIYWARKRLDTQEVRLRGR